MTKRLPRDPRGALGAAERMREIASAGNENIRVTQKLATICGISRQAVYMWYSGVTKYPRGHYMASVARHFDVDLMWIITGEEQSRED